MTIEVVRLDENREKQFLEFVNQDPIEHFFYIMDWKYMREITEIFLAMEDEKIQGLMLIYKGNTVNFTGSRDAVELLIDHVDVESPDITAPLEFENLVLQRFQPQVKNRILRMHLKKGDERIQKTVEPMEIVDADPEGISNLLRESYPIWWEDMTPERVEKFMNLHYWLGIEVDDRIVAIGNTRFTDFGSNIGVIATDKHYRNRGYATSIVSALVEEIFKRTDYALIHVLEDNYPAIHVYEKVGFKPFKKYLIAKKMKRG